MPLPISPPQRQLAVLAACLFLAVAWPCRGFGATTNTWSSSGPAGTVVNALAASTSFVYAGTSGGVFKSSDAGTSWSAVNSGLASTTVNTLVMDPNVSTTLYAGTALGVSKTTNGGATWANANNGLATMPVTALAIDPLNVSILYVGISGNGIFRSSNGGTSWIAINGPLPSLSIRSLAVHPNSAGTVYAGIGGNGIYKSTDGGTTWSAISTGLPEANVDLLVFDRASPPNLYAGTANGIFKLADGGTAWSSSSTGLTNQSIHAIASVATTPTILYAGTSGGIYKSTDGGANWNTASIGLTNPTVRALAIHPTTSAKIFAGTGGGVYTSTDSGATWVVANTGITAADIRSLIIDPAAATNLFAGTAGGVFRSIDSGLSWTPASAGLATTDVNVLTFAGTTLYVGTSGGVFVFDSVNGTWSPASSGLTNSDVRALAADPGLPSTLYAGTAGGLFKTTDGGATWNASGLAGKEVRALVVDPALPSVLYAGTNGPGVFKSTTGGSSWAPVNSGLTSTVINALALSGSNLYAGTYLGSVFKSTDGGTTWSPASNGITNSDIRSVAVTGTSPPLVAAATYGGGVFLSINGGIDWRPLNTGLGSTLVQAVAIDSQSPIRLYAGTAGKGVATLTASATTTVTPVSHAFGNVNITLPATTTFSLANSGIVDLAVSGLTFTGTDAPLFAIQPAGSAPCPTLTPILAPGFSCTVGVTFTPDTPGGKSATLRVASNDLNAPALVTLTGTGVIPPSATIAAPAPGVLPKATSYTVSGTASATGTTLQKVEVSFNNGAWQMASGLANWSYTWVPAADGNFTIRARATDSTGNSQPTPFAVSGVIVNNYLPVSTIIAPTANGALSGTSTTISGVAFDEGAGIQQVEVSTDGGTTWNPTTFTPATGSWNYGWTLPADGNYVIKSRATDTAGDVQNPLTTISVRVDNTRPVSMIAAPADGDRLSGASYVVSGTAADGTGTGVQKVEVSTDGGATWQDATGTTSWTYSWPLPSLYASFTVKARATDRAGNVETVQPSVLISVDNVPPTSAITPLPPYLAGTTYAIAGTASDTGFGVQQVLISLDGSTPHLIATGTSSWTFDWNLPADGSYLIKAAAIDLMGNLQTTPTSATVIVNNSPPTVAITTPPANGAVRGTTTSVSGTATDPGAGVQKVEVQVAGGAWQLASFDPASGAWSYVWTLPSDGSYSIMVRATDNAGKVSTPTTLSVTVDNTPPTSVITAPGNGLMINGNSYAITGTAADSGAGVQRVEVSTDGGTTWQTAIGTTFWSYLWTLPPTSGPRAIKVRAVDLAGNIQPDPLATVTVSVYNVPPTSTITVPASGARLRGSSITVTGTASDLGLGIQSVQLSTDGGSNWTNVTFDAATGTWSSIWSIPADGSYTLRSRALNIVGLAETPTAGTTVTVDNSPPLTSLSGKPPLHANSAVATFSFAANEAVTGFECQLDGSGYAPCSSPKSYPGLVEGNHAFSVRASDLAGNQELTPQAYSWTVDITPPQLTGHLPVSSGSRVSVAAPVTISFSEALNPTTVSAATFTLSPAQAGTIAYDPATRTASFTPTPRLASTTTYTATVSTGVQDLAGNPLAAPVSWNFTTDPDGDFDGNGIVNLDDALRCLSVSVGRTAATAEQLRRGDVAPLQGGKPLPDGKITVGDAVVILERIVGTSAW